jgi:ABC-type branched-subunit amino acid transport system ATPase component
MIYSHKSLLHSADRVLDMCGLRQFADAAVGSLGVEQRKRTTIGVELAAKVRHYASLFGRILTDSVA